MAVAVLMCLSTGWAKEKAQPERFTRYKTDGTVPHYTGESLPNIMIFLVDDMGVMDTSVPMLTDKKGNPKRYRLNDFNRTLTAAGKVFVFLASRQFRCKQLSVSWTDCQAVHFQSLDWGNFIRASSRMWY